MTILPISVCMISGAEAHRIERALASVAGWVSEIVIVLNEEVSDGTEEIARRFGVKVFRESWKGHVAQKNSAAIKATQHWILGLDTDEAVSPELRSEIERVVSSEASRAQAYSFPRRNYYCGRWIRHGDWAPDRCVRLWRKGKGEWIGIDPHDKLQVDGVVERLSACLLHYSNESIDQQLSKIGPYSTQFVKHQVAQAYQPSVWDLTVRPLWRFVRAYVFKLGFLDGWQGYYIAALTAFSTLTRYVKIREAKRSEQPK